MSGLDSDRSVAVCTALDGPKSIRLERLPIPVPADDEVLVRIEACGVNFPDLLMSQNRYQLRLEAPFVPGMEACGYIEFAGRTVNDFTIGDRVIVHARHGMFASHVIAKKEALSHAPKYFTAIQSACFRVATLTAWHALVDRAVLRTGETVLVLGASGGVGLAAVEMAKILGARVIAATSSAEKSRTCLDRGADSTIDYSKEPLVESVRAVAPGGVDVVVDPVGGELFGQAARLPTWNGRYLVVGFASGKIPELTANLPLIKGYALLGVRAGESMRRNPNLRLRADRQLASWADDGYLRPLITKTFPLAHAGDALAVLEQRAAIGRIALIPDHSVGETSS